MCHHRAVSRSDFDRLFGEGRQAVLSGHHVAEVPAGRRSQRWGPSVCLRPDATTAARLASVTATAMQYAGPAHWPTGETTSSHFTVRVLDRFRDDLHPDHRDVVRYLTAIRAAAAGSGTARLRVTGLTLARGSVMAAAEPVGPGADAFAAALADELGEDGWYEAAYDRPFWYANLVHFAGPITSPGALVDWVAEHRELDIGVTDTRVELLDWQYDGRRMMPVHLAPPATEESP